MLQSTRAQLRSVSWPANTITESAPISLSGIARDCGGGTHVHSTGHYKGKAAEDATLHQINAQEALKGHISNKVQTKDQAETHPGGVAATRQKSYQTTTTGAEPPPALAAKQLADMLSRAASEATGEAHKNAAHMHLISFARW